MFPGHGTGHHCAASRWKAAAHDQFVALAEFLHKGLDVRKVVAIVCVSHENPFSIGGLDASTQGNTVTYRGHGNRVTLQALSAAVEATGVAVASVKARAVASEIEA